MRSFLISILLVLSLIATTAAQQSDTPKKPVREKKESKPAETPVPPKPESTPDVPRSTEAPKPEAGPGDKDKEERYDMTEVVPVATHHQVTMGGKALNYTATAGRLPLKRGDGKTEAMMFFVAYTLDGQEPRSVR